MPIVLLLIIGAAAGYLASRLMRVDLDVPTMVFLGVAGALVGGFGLRLLATAAHWFAALVAAVLGAMLLIWLWRVFVLRR